LRVPEERIETRDIKIKSNLAYEEKPVQVLDTKERVTQNRVIKFHKVKWSNHTEQVQLGKGKIICVRFTPLFMKNGRSFKSRDEIPIRGRGCNTLGVKLAVASTFV
jgi:hypothetical protein